MFSLDVFAILGVVLVVILLGVIFLMPGGESSRRRLSRKEKAGQAQDNTDWKEACLKLEKHIHALRLEIEHGKTREKGLERDILIQREKTKKLQERISQERGWQTKEDQDKERRVKENISLRESLQKVEEESQRQHGELLRLERENKEARESAAALAENKRALESQIFKLQAQVDAATQENKILQEQNAKLLKQQEETTWVAKAEYVKLEEQLRVLHKEIEQFRNQGRKDMA